MEILQRGTFKNPSPSLEDILLATLLTIGLPIIVSLILFKTVIFLKFYFCINALISKVEFL